MLVCIGFIHKQFEGRLATKLPDNALYCRIIAHGPGLLNAIAIAFLDKVYKFLAKWMNFLENYRTHREATNALMLKLSKYHCYWKLCSSQLVVPFHLINSNASLLYLAFYVQDKARLQHRLWVLFIISQLLDNVVEVGIPLVVSKLCAYRVKRQVDAPTSPRRKSEKVKRLREQKWQEKYDDSFGDFKVFRVTVSPFSVVDLRDRK